MDGNKIENNNKGKRESFLLEKCLKQYELVLLIVVMSKILSATNSSSLYLQTKDAENITCQ